MSVLLDNCSLSPYYLAIMVNGMQMKKIAEVRISEKATTEEEFAIRKLLTDAGLIVEIHHKELIISSKERT